MSVIINGTDGVQFNDSSLQGAAASPFGLKNRIINGDFRIDQRNAGASVTGNDGTYALDRFTILTTQSSKFTIQQSTTAPTGFNTSLLATSSSAYSVISSDHFTIQQRIEGFNTADLSFGSASASTVTLSFWVRSSLTGTFGGSLVNSAYSRSYPFSYTISSANTWEQKTITIAGDTTGTWIGATNGVGLRISWSLGAGSALIGTAGAWSSSALLGATGQTNLVGTNGATLYITGVQLEVGSTATPFERRLYGTELALCQRYCLKYCGNTNFEDVNNAGIIGVTSTTAYGAITVVVPMRTSPSISSSTVRLTDQSNNIPVTSIVASGSSYSGPYNINCGYNASSGVVQYRPYALSANNSTSAYVILSAEL